MVLHFYAASVGLLLAAVIMAFLFDAPFNLVMTDLVGSLSCFVLAREFETLQERVAKLEGSKSDKSITP